MHRPRYDDWTIPKGKREEGESDLECAVREVEEETGLVGRPGLELLEVRYVDKKGRPKEVRYWAMSVAGGDGVLRHEVDAVAWLTLDEAARRLTYQRDAEVLTSLAERAPSADLDPP